MLPALAPGERVLFDRLAYETDEPRTGDIVLARHVARPRVLMIKRVVGDRPNGFFLMGDNPEESSDSRQLGPFRRQDILARGWVVYWPARRARRLGRQRVVSE
jgi:nickel-type superoxide dismutase maturation protease